MSISIKISERISKELGYDKEKSEVMAYGLFALLQIAFSLMLVAFFGLILGIALQALVFSFAASILRQYSGGAHASEPAICLFIGTIVTIALAYAAHVLAPVLPAAALILIEVLSFSYSYIIIFKYAPVDSPSKPIRTQAKKKKMQKFSFNVLNAYLVFIIILSVLYLKFNIKTYLEISLCICFAVIWQSFNLTLIGHKILGKSDLFLKKIFNLRKGIQNDKD